MAKPIITVENLGKKYKLGQAHKKLLSEKLGDGLRRLAGRALREEGQGEFWALKDVSFEVNQGDVLGIIGRNGAGKSTLLKILSRITTPTTGRLEMYGRVSSLLEVGTGFHPELTGRENVFLNGAILGMGKEEIRRKFDEIVAFAEIDKFIDTPVKRYSSGMYVRLAFAVAAHLEPEILIVDEVLAVGDAQFQKKCLGKMEEVGKEGRTVLFVSHNMAAIRSLCNLAMRLESGRTQEVGEPGRVIDAYLTNDNEVILKQSWCSPEAAPGSDEVRIKNFSVHYEGMNSGDLIYTTTPLRVTYQFWNLVEGRQLNISTHFRNQEGTLIFNCWSESKKFGVGVVEGVLEIPGNILNDGVFTLDFMIVESGTKPVFHLQPALRFQVNDHRENTAWFGKVGGMIRPMLFNFNISQHDCV